MSSLRKTGTTREIHGPPPYSPCAECGKPVSEWYSCFACERRGLPHLLHAHNGKRDETCADLHECPESGELADVAASVGRGRRVQAAVNAAVAKAGRRHGSKATNRSRSRVRLTGRGRGAAYVGRKFAGLQLAGAGSMPGRKSPSSRPGPRRPGPRPGSGGRPVREIPRLVVEFAARLKNQGRGWVDILDAVRRTGNGTWPRNTLKRHVVALLDRPEVSGSMCEACGKATAKSSPPVGLPTRKTR